MMSPLQLILLLKNMVETRNDVDGLGEFENHDDGSNGRVSGRRHHGAHGHQRIGARCRGRAGEPLMDEGAEKPAGGGTQEERGRKDAAGPSTTDGDRSREDLRHQQRAEHHRGKLIGQRLRMWRMCMKALLQL